MAVLHCTGFDHQVAASTLGGGGATSGTTARKWYDASTTPALDTSVFKNGSAAFKVAGNAAGASNYQWTIQNTLLGFGFWWRWDGTTLTGAQRLLRIAPSNHDVFFSAAGAFKYGISAGTSNTLTPTPSANTWYWITGTLDTSTDTAVMTLAIYSASGSNLTGTLTVSNSLTSAQQTSIQFGSGAAAAGPAFWYDDTILTDTATLLAPSAVLLLRPTGNGTSVFTDNDFQNQASGNLTTSSDFSALVNQLPPATTTFVKQVVIRTTGYTELSFADLPATGIGTPTGVQLLWATHPVAASGPNQQAMNLVDGGTTTAEAVTDQTASTDTIEYVRHIYATAPSTSGAWTTAKVNALKAQWGKSGDASPPPALDAVYLEVAAPIVFAGVAKKAMSTGRAIGNRIGIRI